ncbi:head-tail connector protein [Variovorax phage VarioGold]|uniref:hypothetical protein n=1 Tax=Variovorax sp. ZS18.2.2 TaxID=2971255 RepID=UPI0021515404|nr:hypothetical protein [Variovorax sp. ZS18.2.2]MCR6477530.1 hypothetical protein [Variovorax sp. ZS18.2.2]UYD72055.1 head-tail connector protein [Variovorax phage VarioGold]
MTPIIVTPAEQIIDLARAKLHCKLSGSARDPEVTDAIETARAWMQKELAVAVGPQTLKYTFDDWAGCAQLPYDITTVVSVTDATGPVTYTKRERTISASAVAPVEIVITCGWTVASIPGTIKSAMLLLIGDLIENQQAQVEIALHENRAVENLIALERRRVSI